MRRTIVTLFAFGCVVMAPLTVLGLEWVDLEGHFFIFGETLIDPPPSEPRDTHFYVHLAGEGAKQLYAAMKVESVPYFCSNDGSSSKRIGGLQCIQDVDGSGYRCYFGVDIESQEIVVGAAC